MQENLRQRVTSGDVEPPLPTAPATSAMTPRLQQHGLPTPDTCRRVLMARRNGDAAARKATDQLVAEVAEMNALACAVLLIFAKVQLETAAVTLAKRTGRGDYRELADDALQETLTKLAYRMLCAKRATTPLRCLNNAGQPCFEAFASYAFLALKRNLSTLLAKTPRLLDPVHAGTLADHGPPDVLTQVVADEACEPTRHGRHSRS